MLSNRVDKNNNNLVLIACYHLTKNPFNIVN